MSSESAYEGEHTITLTEWERRQTALLVERQLGQLKEMPNRPKGLSTDEFPQTEHETQVEWTVNLLQKLKRP